MRRNNLARNLELFELQRVIAEDDRLYKIDIEKNKQVAQWTAQADQAREIAINKAYSKSQVAFNEGYNQAIRKRILLMMAIGLVLAAVLGAMS